MIAYIDSSVLLRVILQEPNPLKDWLDLQIGVSSKLLRVECYRAFDRLWHTGLISQDQLETKQRSLETFLRRLHLRELDDEVLRLAAQPLPTHLAALDALHLATAMVHRRLQAADERPIVFATHDRALAKAATAMHFEVIGA